MSPSTRRFRPHVSPLFARRTLAQRTLAAVGGAALLAWTCATGATPSATPSVAPPPAAPPGALCETAAHHQFDFWLGDWQVFDVLDHGALVGHDHVVQEADGCIVQQNLQMLSDLYRRPGVPYRMFGLSINRFDGERWLELWADNQWGAIALAGGPDDHYAMVLNTIIPSRRRDLRLVWELHVDGSVEITQYIAPAGSGKWDKYGDLVYRRNR
jgi:hypothetical protein